MIHPLPIYKPTPKVVIPAEIKALLESDCDIIVTFSGGKDSVAQVLYLLELGIDKKRIKLHHHEVDGRGRELFDWACTTSYCQAFADAFGLELTFSWREGGIVREMYRENEGCKDVLYEKDGKIERLKSKKGNTTKRMFPMVHPDLKFRWCSASVKINVFSRYVNNLVQYKTGDLLVLTGERKEESPKREKYKAFQKYSSWNNSRNAWHWRPVLDFTEEMVWDLYRKYNVQPHPCYMLGWNRCSCQLCIFSSANTWASIYELSPAKIFAIDAIEKDLGHTLYNGMTIWEMVDKGTSFLEPVTLARWKEEALSQYVSPIFVEGEWTMPRGAFGVESAGAV